MLYIGHISTESLECNSGLCVLCMCYVVPSTGSSAYWSPQRRTAEDSRPIDGRMGMRSMEMMWIGR